MSAQGDSKNYSLIINKRRVFFLMILTEEERFNFYFFKVLRSIVNGQCQIKKAKKVSLLLTLGP